MTTYKGDSHLGKRTYTNRRTDDEYERNYYPSNNDSNNKRIKLEYDSMYYRRGNVYYIKDKLWYKNRCRYFLDPKGKCKHPNFLNCSYPHHCRDCGNAGVHVSCAKGNTSTGKVAIKRGRGRR